MPIRTHFALLAVAALLPRPADAAAGDDDLRRCRALADAAQRLACYDALPAAPAASAAPAPAPAAPAAQAAHAASAAQAAAFGLAARREVVLDRIESQIVGTFEGWGRNTRFQLANGQVWQVSDGSSGVYYLQSPRVRVVRAALGSFILEIDGVTWAPRVRRVQ